MPVFENNPFPEVTDFGGYQNWNKVVLPDGRVLYEVPGNPGYVYDPVRSRATGRQSFTINPKMQLAEMERQRQQQDAQLEQQEYMNSPMGQAVPIVGSLGGMYLASKLAQGGSLFGGGAAAPGAVLSSTSLPSVAASGGGASLGSSGTMTLPASSVPGVGEGLGSTLSSIAPYAGLAGAGLGAYGLYNAFGANNRKAGATQGALSGAGMGAGLAAAAPLLGLGPVGWAGLGLAALGGGALGGGLGGAFANKSTKQRETERWQGTNIDPARYQDMIQRDYFAGTGGEKSRDEKFLTADAIRFNPDNYNNVQDWDTWDKQKQDTFLNAMLQAGKVREKKGGIYYDDDFAKQLANKVRNNQPLDAFAAAAAGAAPRLTPGAQAPAMAPGGPQVITEDQKRAAIKRFMRR